jgi:hypothetical protein
MRVTTVKFIIIHFDTQAIGIEPGVWGEAARS